MIKFRPLEADEIDCRIGSVAKDGSWVTLLLYKDARCDNIENDKKRATVFYWKAKEDGE